MIGTPPSLGRARHTEKAPPTSNGEASQILKTLEQCVTETYQADAGTTISCCNFGGGNGLMRARSCGSTKIELQLRAQAAPRVVDALKPSSPAILARLQVRAEHTRAMRSSRATAMKNNCILRARYKGFVIQALLVWQGGRFESAKRALSRRRSRARAAADVYSLEFGFDRRSLDSYQTR